MKSAAPDIRPEHRLQRTAKGPGEAGEVELWWCRRRRRDPQSASIVRL